MHVSISLYKYFTFTLIIYIFIYLFFFSLIVYRHFGGFEGAITNLTGISRSGVVPSTSSSSRKLIRYSFRLYKRERKRNIREFFFFKNTEFQNKYIYLFFIVIFYCHFLFLNSLLLAFGKLFQDKNTLFVDKVQILTCL